MTMMAQDWKGVLDRESIRELVHSTPPLVTGYKDLEKQLQPNGFDLTLAVIGKHDVKGSIGVDEVHIGRASMVSSEAGWYDLEPGSYLLVFSETVHLPKSISALVRPRSSLVRSGVSIHTGVWDAGYTGQSGAMMTVSNPDGLHLQEGVRIAQMIFLPLTQADEVGYNGQYQNERV